MKKTTHEIEGGRKLYMYSFGADPTAERQRRFWNSVGDAWKSESAEIEEWLQPLTAAIHSRIGDYPRRALDVGCGSSSMPMPSRWTTFGIDPAVEMLVPGKTVHGDPAAMPLQDATFDAVVSRLSVMLASEPVVVFKEIRRVLRMAGTFTFAVWADRASNAWSDAVEDEFRQELGIREPLPGEPSAYRLASKSEVQDMINKAGMRLLSSDQVTLPYLARLSPEVAFEFLRKYVGPIKTMYEKLPEERREPFVARVVARLAATKRDGLAWVHHAEREVKFD